MTVSHAPEHLDYYAYPCEPDSCYCMDCDMYTGGENCIDDYDYDCEWDNFHYHRRCMPKIAYQLVDGTDYIWGSSAIDPKPISDFVPPKVGTEPGRLTFCWTGGDYDNDGFSSHPKYVDVEIVNDSSESVEFRFHRPMDDTTVTGWMQTVVMPQSLGKAISEVYGGNIEQIISWLFAPLNELLDIPYRIPDLAPGTADTLDTIYCAVNLKLYLQRNPNGFLEGEWEVGQTLDELSVIIINGQVPGLYGIYWATSEFTFDPDSYYGYVPLGGLADRLNSADFTSIEIIAEHKAQDEMPDICGDANSDGTVNISDAVWVINYVFVGGEPPDPLFKGDANCDGSVNISDAVWIINFVFAASNSPCDTDGDEVPDC